MLFKKSEDKPYWYSNPWGLGGGLFGSVTIIFSIGMAYKANWLTNPSYVIFISVLIFGWGYMHSKLIEQLNAVFADREYIMALMESQHKLILLTKVRAEAEEEIISRQLEKIKLLEVKIEALETKV